MNLSEQIKIQWGHAVVVRDSREEVHEDKLAITFATIARLFLCRGFLLSSAFDDDDRWSAATSDS